MSVLYKTYKLDDSLLRCLRHSNILSYEIREDREKKLNSLDHIHSNLSEYFSRCNEYQKTDEVSSSSITSENEDKLEDKEKYTNTNSFIVFFCEHLCKPLLFAMNDPYDECRYAAINILFLLECKLQDEHLHSILFFQIFNTNTSLIQNSIQRLKHKEQITQSDKVREKERERERENTVPLEEKEEIRLCILQLLFKILMRYNTMQKNKKNKNSNILNLYPYSNDLLCSLIHSLKDPFAKIKIIACDILCILNFEKEQQQSENIYKELFTNLLHGLNCRQWKVRKAILTCLRVLLGFEALQNFFEPVLDHLKKIGGDKVEHILLQLLECVLYWNENVKRIKEKEIAKLVLLVLICMSNENFPNVKTQGYETLEKISQYHENQLCKRKEKKRTEFSKEKESNEYEKEEEFIYCNKFEIISAPTRKIHIRINHLFRIIKKELFDEIMKNEKNRWNEDDYNETKLCILNIFLLGTNEDSYLFIKPILSFLYKTIASTEYSDYSSSVVLIDHLVNLLKSKNKDKLNTHLSLIDQSKTAQYFSKILCCTIISGYVIPLEIFLLEISQRLLGNSLNRVIQQYREFVETKKSNEDSNLNKNIFLNAYHQEYQERMYEKEMNRKRLKSNKNDLNKNDHDKRETINEIDKDLNNINVHNDTIPWDHSLYNNLYFSCNENKKEVQLINESEMNESSVACEKKSISFSILSQVIIGYYIRNKQETQKPTKQYGIFELKEEQINFLLFLINEHMNIDNSNLFPFIYIIVRYLIKILKEQCEKYSNVLFHFLLLLQLNEICEIMKAERLITKLEKMCTMNSKEWYQQSFHYFITHLQDMIDFSNFQNFKSYMKLFLLLLKNVQEEDIMKDSNEIITFFKMMKEQELSSVFTIEVLLVLYYMSNNERFLPFFLKYTEEIVGNVILPLCVWKVGLSEAKIRKTAFLCLQKLLNYEIFADTLFKKKMIIDNLIEVIQSSIDDTWHTDNRNISVIILKVFATRIKNNTVLNNILDTLVKLLEDSNNSIRINSIQSMLSLFKNESLQLSQEKAEQIFSIFFLHLDDEEQEIRNNLFQILLQANKLYHPLIQINAKKSAAYSMHAKEMIKHFLE